MDEELGDSLLDIHHADQMDTARREASEAVALLGQAERDRRRRAGRVLYGLMAVVPAVAAALVLGDGPAGTAAEAAAFVLAAVLVAGALQALIGYQRARLRSLDQLRRARRTLRVGRRARGHLHRPGADPRSSQDG